MDAIENEHNTSAGDGGLCSGSIHQRRKMDAIDDEHKTSVVNSVLCSDSNIGGGRWMQSTSDNLLLSLL